MLGGTAGGLAEPMQIFIPGEKLTPADKGGLVMQTEGAGVGFAELLPHAPTNAAAPRSAATTAKRRQGSVIGQGCRMQVARDQPMSSDQMGSRAMTKVSPSIRAHLAPR